MFTDGVLYLNVQRQNVEQYWGNYYDVVDQIAAQLERERQQNARMEKEIQDSKDKINFFSNKGGKMRKLASKMRDDVAEAEELLQPVPVIRTSRIMMFCAITELVNSESAKPLTAANRVTGFIFPPWINVPNTNWLKTPLFSLFLPPVDP